MICLICRTAEVVEGLTPVQLERGEMKIVIDHVPARVCPGCGEAYMEEDVAVRLIQVAAEVSKAGVLEGLLEYKSLT